MENILIKNFENQYHKIKKDKKNISKLIKNIKGGERIVIQDPKILTKKLEDIKALLENYNNEKKVINYEPIKEALKEINQLSKRIEAIKQNITKVKQKDNASEISQELIDESLNLFKNINFEELEDDTLKLSIAKKPVIIDVPIDLKKEQLDQISEKFVGEYYDIKTQLKGNPDDFEDIIENLEEKISEIKEQYEQYKNDTEYTKQQIDFYNQTLYPKFEEDEFTSIKSNDLGPDIVSLKNYMIQLNPVKSDEIDSKYQEISNFVAELQTDVQLNLPERNELQIIADPTFDKSEGSVFYQDPEKEEERRKFEESKKKEELNKQIEIQIQQIEIQIQELEKEKDELQTKISNINDEKIKELHIELFNSINFRGELQLDPKYILNIQKLFQIKELFNKIKRKNNNNVTPDNISTFIKKITGKNYRFVSTKDRPLSAPLYRDNIQKKEINIKINNIINELDIILRELENKDKYNFRLNQIADKIKELEQKKVNSQLGGTAQVEVERLNIIDKNDTLMQKTLEYSQSISTLNSILSEYYKVIEAYNILYLQVSFYQIFLFLSTTRQIATEETMMYKYISLGTCNYYKRIIDSILVKIEKKDNSQVIMYFKKYHLILLKKLQDFLKQIGNLKQMKNNSTEKLAEIDKRDNIDIEKCQDNVKNMFHLLNLFKDILDNYKHMFSDKVSIFARINDFQNEMVYTKNFINDPYWDTSKDYKIGNKNRAIENRIEEEFIFTRDKDDSSKLNVDGFNCEKLLNDDNKVTDLDIKYKNIVENGVKFSEVFNTQEFPDNDTLSLYMGLSSQISQKKGTMLITYGYSGVGKTATLFGSSQFPGLLQRTLMNIKSGNDSQILFRVFELYGKGFKYFFYWNPENGAQHKHHQSVYQYVLKLQGGEVNVDKVLEKKDEAIGDFIKQSEDLNNNIDSYITITHDQYKNFDTIVDAIDKERLEAGRIRSTSNNPVSSRSIVFYEFQILIDKEYVPFIVMDLPGKENIINTFVDGIQDIKINKEPKIDKFTKAAMFLDPLYLPTINSIFAKIILNTVYQEYNDVFNKFMNKKYFTVVTSQDKDNYGDRFEYDFSNDLDNLTQKITAKYNKNISTDDFKAQYGALELMKYLIENNHFEIIEEINLKLFGEISSEESERIKSATKGAFEGIYINENILGIIVYIIKNILKKDNSDNYISRQSDPYLELKDKYNQKFDKTEPFKTSLEAATFNFRDLIRGRNNMYFDNGENVFNRFDVPNNQDRFFDNILTDIQNSYDPKKTYNSDNPLIGDILKPYLEKIENYFMFYLLSNNDPDTKCEKQMKLLDGSYNFIKALNQSE